MSGIYIPGLAMPTNCLDCPVYWDKCPNFETEGEEYLERIHPDCPLVPVPEHGRLIDADRLRHSHCAECTLYPDNCLGDECDWDSIFHIDHAPTIIPADPADKEGEG